MISLSVGVIPGLSWTKAQGVSPHFSSGHHGGERHRLVLVECDLHLDARNVLAAGNDDVLGAVLDLDVAVRMLHGEVAGMHPAGAESFGRRLRFLEVPEH